MLTDNIDACDRSFYYVFFTTSTPFETKKTDRANPVGTVKGEEGRREIESVCVCVRVDE